MADCVLLDFMQDHVLTPVLRLSEGRCAMDCVELAQRIDLGLTQFGEEPRVYLEGKKRLLADSCTGEVFIETSPAAEPTTSLEVRDAHLRQARHAFVEHGYFCVVQECLRELAQRPTADPRAVLTSVLATPRPQPLLPPAAEADLMPLDDYVKAALEILEPALTWMVWSNMPSTPANWRLAFASTGLTNPGTGTLYIHIKVHMVSSESVLTNLSEAMVDRVLALVPGVVGSGACRAAGAGASGPLRASSCGPEGASSPLRRAARVEPLPQRKWVPRGCDRIYLLNLNLNA